MTPLYLLINGGYVVYIFWMLSAFLLCYLFLGNRNNKKMAERAIKRYVGLLLLIFVTYFIAYIFIKWHLFYNVQASYVSGSEWFAGFYSWDPTIKQLLQSLFLDTFLTANVPFNPVLWTMKVEFLGTLIEIFILILFDGKKCQAVIIAITCIFIMYAFPLQYLCFPLGIILAKVAKKVEEGSNDYGEICGITIFILSLYGGGYPSDFEPISKVYSWIPTQVYIWDTRTLIYIIAGFACVLSVVMADSLKKFFSVCFFEHLGSYSTEIYMCHFVVECSVSAYVFLQFYDLEIGYIMNMFLTLGITLIAVCLSAVMLRIINRCYTKCVEIEIVKWLE